MPDVTHSGSDGIGCDGTKHPVEVHTGSRAMRDAIGNNARATGAGRGGGRTSPGHADPARVDPAWLATTRLSGPGSQRASALRSAAVTQPHRRLSPQIAISEVLARRIVRVPAAQH
jgi:hypothetical protein